MGISDDLLARFTRALSTQASPDLPRRMCAAFADVVGAEGAAIALGSTPASRSVLAATDVRTEQLQDLQDMVGEGPSLRAMEGDGPWVLRPEEADRTWPMLASAMAKHAALHGIPAVYAFPMRPQREVLGVLTAHQSRADRLRITLEEAQVLADAVGVAVLGDVGSGTQGEERWLRRDRIAQATGMVIAQLGIVAPDALAVLRAHAYAIDTSLSEVSRRVIDRSLRFTHNSEEES